VVSDFGGHGFDGLAELGGLNGQNSEREGVLAPLAVLCHDGLELLAAIESGPIDPGSGRDCVEGDLLADGSEIDAGLFDARQSDGQLNSRSIDGLLAVRTRAA
jgi:hypothetical protein